VRELNDEKIDVIEWDPDQTTFIAKALSPARVSQVYLEDHPNQGKTAVVIVPDDQLSLAIGREGQNARLAAKLTGWRIDIKSLTEAADESLRNLNNKAADPAIVRNKDIVGQVELVLAKKEANRPITSEDYMILNRLVSGVEGRITAIRAKDYDKINKARAEARKDVPAYAWNVPLNELELSTRVQGLLTSSHIRTLGDLLMFMILGEETLLEISGFGQKAFDEVKTAVEHYTPPEPVEIVEVDVGIDDGELPIESTDSIDDIEAVEEEPEVIPVAGVALDEAVEPIELKEIEEPELADKIIPEEIELEEPEAPIPDIDDLGVSLVDLTEVEEQPKKKKIVLVSPEKALVLEPSEVDKTGRQKRELVFDEHQGKVVAKRKRKSGRRRPEWEEFDNIDDIEVDDVEVDDVEVDDVEVDDVEVDDVEVDDVEVDDVEVDDVEVDDVEVEDLIEEEDI
jgi:N utilization substance protein A